MEGAGCLEGGSVEGAGCLEGGSVEETGLSIDGWVSAVPVESNIPRETGLLGWWEVNEWAEDSSGSCACVSVKV